MSATALLAPSPGPMTTEEFLLWDSGDGLTWQLVDGQPQLMGINNRTHGALQSELGAVIGMHLRANVPGSWILTNPAFVPEALGGANVRIADLAVTCSPYIEEEATLNGAVLVIEILSPGNADETWSNAGTYLTIPTVTEILVVSAERIGAHVMRRRPDLSWPPEFAELTGGDLTLDSIGLRVPLSDLYRTTRLAP